MKLLLSDTSGQIHIIPDSAIGRDSQPWFLPDFGEAWRGYDAVAVRVSRLGKSIAPKFAERYVDAMTTIWVAEADECNALDFMDGRVMTGQWHNPESGEDLNRLLSLMVKVSAFATLKNGDIIAIAKGQPQPIEINSRIENSCLKFNIK